MNKLKCLIFLFSTFPTFIYAEEIEENLIDARSESSSLLIFEFTKDICEFRLGTSGYDSEIQCSTTECKKKLKIIESNYNLDILVTPEYKMVLASTNRNGLRETKISTSYTDIYELMTGWEVEVDKVPFQKKDASDIAACINQIGNELAGRLLSDEQKKVIDNGDVLTFSNKVNNIEKKFIEDELEFAKLEIVYPELLEDSNSGFIYVTVIPSMRFANRPNVMNKSEIKSAAIELKEIAKRMSPNNEDVSGALSKLKSGDAIYRMSKWTDGEIVQIDNKFKTLKLNIVGNGFEVTSLSPEHQVLSPFVESRWVWQIKPSRASAGDPLILVAESKSSENSNNIYSNQIPIVVKYEKSIINMSWGVVISNWQFILGTVLIPLGVYIWKRRKSSSAA